MQGCVQLLADGEATSIGRIAQICHSPLARQAAGGPLDTGLHISGPPRPACGLSSALERTNQCPSPILLRPHHPQTAQDRLNQALQVYCDTTESEIPPEVFDFENILPVLETE